jgi:hypothetical protein
MHPTNRLFGAGMEHRNGLRKGTPPCRSKPACAAARETGSSGFHGHRSIPMPARKAWINKRSTGFGLWRLEIPARQGTYGLSAVWQARNAARHDLLWRVPLARVTNERPFPAPERETGTFHLIHQNGRTTRSGILWKSFRLLVTNGMPCTRAVAAIHKSLVPIRVPFAFR